MRAREARVAKRKRDRKQREKRNSGFDCIFRDGLYLTPLSHDVAIAVGEIGVPEAAIGAPLCGNNDVGTAPATPILERVDAVRRRMLVPSRFVPWQRIDPCLFFFRPFCLPLSLTHSFHSLSSFLIPSSRGDAHISPSFRNTFSPAPSLASTFTFPVPPRCFSVVSRPRRAPYSHSHALDVDVPPPPETGERTSPSRITPRPRERSVTTKVLVKS